MGIAFEKLKKRKKKTEKAFYRLKMDYTLCFIMVFLCAFRQQFK